MEFQVLQGYSGKQIVYNCGFCFCVWSSDEKTRGGGWSFQNSCFLSTTFLLPSCHIEMVTRNLLVGSHHCAQFHLTSGAGVTSSRRLCNLESLKWVWNGSGEYVGIVCNYACIEGKTLVTLEITLKPTQYSIIPVCYF